jgi:6-pyruvoyltetrahydropterin/6-carboxytetrahydropterin synthase
MMEVTRRATFSACHRLHNPELSDEENRAIYGRCNNEHGHGHNYCVEVTVRGEPDPRTGITIDFNRLKTLLDEEVLARFDHRNINLDVEVMRGIISTSENLAIAIWRLLAPRIDHGRLVEVRVYESDDNYVTYRREAEDE